MSYPDWNRQAQNHCLTMTANREPSPARPGVYMSASSIENGADLVMVEDVLTQYAQPIDNPNTTIQCWCASGEAARSIIIALRGYEEFWQDAGAMEYFMEDVETAVDKDCTLFFFPKN